MDYRIGKIITSSLLVLAFIAFIVGLNNANTFVIKLNHNMDKVVVKLVSVSSREDDENYYIDAEFEIKNNAGTSVQTVDFTTEYKDKSSASTIKVNSSVNTVSNGNYLRKGQTTSYTGTVECPKDKFGSDKKFCDLLENGIANLKQEITVTKVYWADGKYSTRK